MIPARIAKVLLARDRSAWRFVLPWLASLRPGVDPVSLGLPWLAFGAIEWLQRNVRTGWRVLELGSGGSTIFFRRRVRELVSVEHDPGWYDRIKELVPSGPGFTYLLEREEDFAHVVTRYPDRHFDLVLVDGGSDRAEALRTAAHHVAPGGVVMLDNADLAAPQALTALARHPRLDFRGVAPWNLHRGRIHLQTTSLWRIGGAETASSTAS